MSKESRNFKKYHAAILSGTLTEGDIRGLRKGLNAQAYEDIVGRSSSMTSPKYLEGELDTLLELIEKHHPRVTTEQGDKGLAWLMNLWKSPTGKERKHNPFDSFCQDVLTNYSYFTTVGFHADYNSIGLAHRFPIYRCIATDGRYFDYVSSSWQSGLPLEIYSRGNLHVNSFMMQVAEYDRQQREAV